MCSLILKCTWPFACFVLLSDPNILYGSKRPTYISQGNDFSSIKNGGISSQESSPKKHKTADSTKVYPESGVSPAEKDPKPLENGHSKPPLGQRQRDREGTNHELTNRIMKGDLSLYNEAKVHRERQLRERLMKRERMAQVMAVQHTFVLQYIL